MKSVMDYFKGTKNASAPDEEQKQKQIKANPVNLETRVMQVKDITSKRKKMLDEMGK